MNSADSIAIEIQPATGDTSKYTSAGCVADVVVFYKWTSDAGKVTRSDPIHRDTVDLDSVQDRSWFAAEVAKATGSQEAGDRITELLRDKHREMWEQFEADLALGKFQKTDDDESDWQPDLLSQLANAEQLVVELQGNARFNVSTGEWMRFRGGRYVSDETGYVARVAKRVAKSTRRFILNQPPGIDLKTATRHALDSEKASGIAAMMKLAQTEKGISVCARDFDRDGHLLNLLNGTLNLRTGSLQEHCREDLLSKQAPVKFDWQAQCPLWDSFLNRIMDGNGSMITYLARIFGAAAAAQATLQELFIFHGGGANGKNVLLDTICGLLGDYAGTAPDSLLTVRAMGAEHPTEIADLCGKRLVYASETEHGAKLRVQLVKRLTGDATLKARFMRQDYFEFPRTHTLILVTNNKPTIGETTHAIWRRVRLVPFNVTIPLEERDDLLTEKLKAEWPGILNWVAKGFLDYQGNGMQTPEDVLIATELYQMEQDPLAEFINERCIRGEKCVVTRHALRAEYVAWAKSAGDCDSLDPHAFYDQIRRVPGVEETKRRIEGKTPRVFTGIGLANLSDQYRQAQEEFAG